MRKKNFVWDSRFPQQRWSDEDSSILWPEAVSTGIELPRFVELLASIFKVAHEQLLWTKYTE